MKLANKVALITGAAQGIGRGIAEVFAREGADVIISDIAAPQKSEALAQSIRNQGRRTRVHQADASDREQVEAMFERAWKELGPIDILVNNAGIETIVPFLEMTDQQWADVTNVNLKSGWLCSQVFCKRVTSSKLAIEALTRNMSAEMTPLGIRVNCIHPGLIETPMTDWVMKDPEILPVVLAQITMGRAGQPCEIGTVAAFLASDEARYVTGQSIYVDGGWVNK